MDLVTTAEVASSWPGFSKLPATEQAALISEASQAIEDYCRRSFGSGVVTETQDGSGWGRIWLRRRPVISVTSVTVNQTAYTNSGGTDWQVNLRTGELVRGSGLSDSRFASPFPRGTNNVVIIYTYGFAAVPSPVKRACRIVIRQMSEATKVAGVYTSERIGDYQYQLDPTRQYAIPDAALRLLASYVVDDIS